MQSIYGDLFKQTDADAICITTNGFVKSNGECVMGRGCAKRATQLYPNIAKTLGNAIRHYGNKVLLISHPEVKPALVSFPVKPIIKICNQDRSNVVKHMRKQFNPGDKVPGWACVADPFIITNSALALRTLTDNMNWLKVVLPRPGCGAGELYWTDIEPVLQKVLDDRFYTITFE